MISGNEKAIDLGLELAHTLFPNQSISQPLLAGLIDYSRQILGLQTKPFNCQDLFYLEHRALQKMKRASHVKSSVDWAERLEEVSPLCE